MSTETYDNPPTATTDSKLALITELWQSGMEEWTAETIISQESGETTLVRSSVESGPTDALIKHFDGLIDRIVDTGTMDAIRATYGQQRRLADALYHFAGTTNPFDNAAVEKTAKEYGVDVADLIDAAWRQLQDGAKQPPVATPAEATPPRSLLWASPSGDREILTRAAIARRDQRAADMERQIKAIAAALRDAWTGTANTNIAAAIGYLGELASTIQDVPGVGYLATDTLDSALETIGLKPTQ